MLVVVETSGLVVEATLVVVTLELEDEVAVPLLM